MTSVTTRYRRPAKVQHLTVAERVTAGKAARAQTPRSSQAIFDPPPSRPDPVELLESQGASRVQELLPIRYGRMAESAFGFYRGAALVMANDLAGTANSGIRVQACGDAHLSNFGAFASPERDLVFDTNDFDETNPGPWEWDLKRLVTSFEVATRERGISAADRRTILLTCVKQYRDSMRAFAGMNNLELWYQRIDEDRIAQGFGSGITKQERQRLRRTTEKARSRDSIQAFAKFTSVVDGERRIISDPPLIVTLDDMLSEAGASRDQVWSLLMGVVRRYRATLATDRRHLLEQFHLVDVARKVVGVGSVGTRCWMALFLGRDNEDPLFLQIKEAQESVLEAFTGRSEYSNAGARVVAGQRLMQSASDIFLGWDRAQAPDGATRDFYVRQLRDWKGSADIAVMGTLELTIYSRLCAWTLAKGHARSGDRIALAAYLGSGNQMDKAVADFAVAYADQNEKDHAALVTAIDSGRITAEQGV